MGPHRRQNRHDRALFRANRRNAQPRAGEPEMITALILAAAALFFYAMHVWLTTNDY
jgi:hypothetical protein